jgi:hypothetical protein
MAKEYDIFLSYRRQGGEATAKIICDRLSDRGHKVFYDVEALRSGAFNTKLYSVIEECRDFIVILSPDSLDRCGNENDWVRLEIAHAIKTGKNVIPVFLRGFQFPQELPEDIVGLRYQNGLEANSEFFDAFIARLCTFLLSKPPFFQRIRKNPWLKWIIPVSLVILAAVGLFLYAPDVFQGRNHLVQQAQNGKTPAEATFPETREEKFIAEETFDYIEKNLSMMDAVFGNIAAVYEECENYLINTDPVQYEKTMTAINEAYKELNNLNISSYALSDNLSRIIDTTPINRGDLVAVNGYGEALCESYASNLLFLKYVFKENAEVDKTTKKRILDIYGEMQESDVLSLVYGLNELLLPIGNPCLKDFKQTCLFPLENIPFGTQAWISNKSEEYEISRITNANFAKQEKKQKELESLLGEEKYADMVMESELEQYAQENGLSQNEIDAFLSELDGSGSFAEVQQKLDEATQELSELKNEAKTKFAPKDTDEPEILWGKMLRFLTLKMYDEAAKCAEMYQLKTEKENPEAKAYVPAVIRFINQISFTGVDYGVVICGYEPGKPKHAVYQTGDIVIAINGAKCLNYNDYMERKPKNVDYTATLLRPDKNNMLKRVDVTVPAGQPKVQLMDLTEKE